MLAAKDPFSHLNNLISFCGTLNLLVTHRRRWLISSAADSGTSVSALLGFTYVRVQRSLAFATSSKHKIRSSARNMFCVVRTSKHAVRSRRGVTCLGKDAHAVDPLLAEPLCHRMIAVKILFQRAALYRSVTISGESAREDCKHDFVSSFQR